MLHLRNHERTSLKGEPTFFTLANLAEGYYCKSHSRQQSLLRGHQPREGSFTTTLQSLTKKQPPAVQLAAAPALPRKKPTSGVGQEGGKTLGKQRARLAASTGKRYGPYPRRVVHPPEGQVGGPSNAAGPAPTRQVDSEPNASQIYYCVLCEFSDVRPSNSILPKHYARDHPAGYAVAQFEGKLIIAPKNAVENEELASCCVCHKVLFKHRAKPGNHDCKSKLRGRSKEYMDSIDEGEGAEYCLMCQLFCGNADEHHKIVHSGNDAYKIEMQYGLRSLVPSHLNYSELNLDSTDDGRTRFSFINRPCRSIINK